MKNGQWQKVTEIFDKALRQKPEDRLIYLRRICGKDKELLNELETLFVSLDKTNDFLEKPAIEEVAEVIANEIKSFKIGERLGHYEIIKQIGSGGMGEVYLANDRKLDRKVAIKILNSKFAKHKTNLQRFIREAKSASGLNHPNILVIHEIGEQDDVHFIISEYIEGKTLREIIKANQLDLNKILNVSIEIANALSAAHQSHIIHRDIKPENIIIRPDGYTKILDFGLAKLVEQKAFDFDDQTAKPNDTAKGIILGTVNYMSPEQAKGEKIDERTDIFSLGILIFEMLTGTTPFTAETMSETFANLINREPNFTSTSVIPSQIQSIVFKMLCKNKEQRYQTMKQVLNDLTNLQEQLKFAEQMGQPRHFENQTVEITNVTGDIKSQTISNNFFSTFVLKKRQTIFILFLCLVVAVSIFGFVYLRLLSLITVSETFSHFHLSRLTNSGNVEDVALSPDGNLIAFTTEEKEGVSLSVRQVGMNNSINILSPQKGRFSGLTFSPDGKLIYYSLVAEKSDPECYVIPALGGIARKLPGMSAQTMAFAPDGKRYLYINSFIEDGQKVVGLFIANLDGGNEIMLAKRKQPTMFSVGGQSYAWSPDGKSIAIIVHNKDAEGEFSTLVGINSKDGSERLLSSKHWNYLNSVQWMKDGNGLLAVGSDKRQTPSQIWYVTSDGSARQVTNDLNSYLQIGVTPDAKQIITLQKNQTSTIEIGDTAKNFNEFSEIINENGALSPITITNSGKIVFRSMADGKSNLWQIQPGGEPKQITSDGQVDFRGICVMPETEQIIFPSSKAGTVNLWSVDLNGNNLKQLTFGEGEFFPVCSPDNHTIIYQEGFAFGLIPTLWKVSIEVGQPVHLTNYSSNRPALSPDGQHIAFFNLTDDKWRIVIISSNDGATEQSFDVPDGVFDRIIRWSPDQKSLFYAANTGKVGNIWQLPFNGQPPKQVTNFNSQFLEDFLPIRDGKQFIVTRVINSSDIVSISEE